MRTIAKIFKTKFDLLESMKKNLEKEAKKINGTQKEVEKCMNKHAKMNYIPKEYPCFVVYDFTLCGYEDRTITEILTIKSFTKNRLLKIVNSL